MLRPIFALFPLLLSPLTLQQPAASTTMPTDAKSLVNPVKPTAQSQAQAKKMYGYDCTICHGEKGDGKGEIAAEQKPPLKDWTDPAALQGMTDGEIFYIIQNGKGTMTGEGARLKADDVWNMVVLVRSFAKKT